ncbi:alpha/beta fold hydrolase [Chryseobacterium tructae]|uniref:Alpha/beta hydrolase family protein n=1 Tax=Chryseobacterium tructae TaxID=1037380 RepID=A0ABV7XVR7_9FLAO|nr:alpha/beta fold hydrolase [Chryseobacterium tructae]MDN3692365.1 alpha/beta fold hydrolase [Chryseobacterium tructae]
MKKIILSLIAILLFSTSIFAQNIQLKRPQEPLEPYPYYSEDITFKNKQAEIHLAGTLTLPSKEGVFPAVILISGSGPQNRNEELAGHKPFLVLSDYLTKKGFAVLRYDDRGTALSQGDFKNATSVDLATDVESAVAYLKTRKEIDPKKIGLIGHSEGGLLAPLVAVKSKDIACIVMLGGPGIPGDKILLIQQRLIAEASGTSEEEIKWTESINRRIFDIVKKSSDTETLKKDLRSSLEKKLSESPNLKSPNRISDDAFINVQIDTYATPWMQYFIKYNPASTLEKVKIPVLALNGETDLQITSKENLKAIKKALRKARNKNVRIKELPGLNHLFQESDTGAPQEYQRIEQTYSPIVLKEVSDWLHLQIQ